MSSDVPQQAKFCSACNKPFICGSAEDGEACWCQDYPAVLPLETDQDCLCRECLGRAIDEKIIK